MAQALATNDRATWAEIRDAAFQVVLLTRRKDGSWKLPTAPRELGETHHDPGTLEALLRAGQGFGYTSLTVCLCALDALAESTGTCPDDVANEALQSFDRHKGPDGGFGTPIETTDLGVKNSLPRHTAAAAAVYLLFARNMTPREVELAAEPPIRWLLRKRERRLRGWPHSWGALELELGYFSTATAILALCAYLERCQPAKGLARSVRTAVREAYAALADEQNLGLWDGDQIRAAHQTLYSACTIRFLRMADRHGTLSDLVPPDASSPVRLVELLSSHIIDNATPRKDGTPPPCLDSGWPDSRGEPSPSSIATISVLDLVLETGNPGGIKKEVLKGAEQLILRDWRTGAFGSSLRAWDWQCLALLATRKSGPIPKARARDLVRTCDRIRADWCNKSLKPSALKPFNENARTALTFALTDGRDFRTRQIGPWLLARGVDFVNELVLRAAFILLGALITLFVLLAQGPDTLDRIHAFLERLGP